MTRWLPFLFIAPFAWAQFGPLVVSDDGATVWFGSLLRQKDTQQGEGPKLFRIRDGRIELVASRDCGGCAVVSVSASVDGSVATLSTGWFLSATDQPYQTLLVRGSLTEVLDRAAAISPNGRFLLRWTPARPDDTPELRDLLSGRTVPITGYRISGDAEQRVADDGSVVVSNDDWLAVWREGSARRLAIANEWTGQAVIDRAATRVVYEFASGGIYRLASFDLRTQRNVELARGGIYPQLTRGGRFPGSMKPRLSASGDQVLVNASTDPIRGPRTLSLLATAGSGGRDLAPAERHALSGDGRVTIAARGVEGLQAVDLATGDTRTLIPRTPFASDRFRYAPGAWVAAEGGNLEDSEGRIRVLLDGQSAFVIPGSRSHAVQFKLPWDLPVGKEVEVSYPSDSPFTSSYKRMVDASAQRPWLYSVVHGDFSGFVSSERPAAPGQLVVVYMTGLGDVRPRIPFDRPAQPGELIEAVIRPECTFAQERFSAPIETVYAGLAPGTTFIYQVNLRLPQAWSAAPSQIRCGGDAIPLATSTPPSANLPE